MAGCLVHCLVQVHRHPPGRHTAQSAAARGWRLAQLELCVSVLGPQMGMVLTQRSRVVVDNLPVVVCFL
jgi:hypothetical protein